MYRNKYLNKYIRNYFINTYEFNFTNQTDKPHHNCDMFFLELKTGNRVLKLTTKCRKEEKRAKLSTRKG